MSTFPQLLTGAIAMYPIRLRHRSRTVVNEFAGGGRRLYGDANGTERSWRLEFADLTREEMDRIQVLFSEVEGRLGAFLFLDPTQNLLRWSEDLSRSVWLTDPLLTVALQPEGPLPHVSASTLANGAAADQGIAQTILAPAGFTYCFSVYCRSQSGAPVRISWTDGSMTESRSVTPDSKWRRYFGAGSLASTTDNVTFRLDVAAGGTVDVAGLMVEAQASPGPYRRSDNTSGVIERARFDGDVLRFRATGVNQYAGVCELVSAE